MSQAFNVLLLLPNYHQCQLHIGIPVASALGTFKLTFTVRSGLVSALSQGSVMKQP